MIAPPKIINHKNIHLITWFSTKHRGALATTTRTPMAMQKGIAYTDSYPPILVPTVPPAIDPKIGAVMQINVKMMTIAF